MPERMASGPPEQTSHERGRSRAGRTITSQAPGMSAGRAPPRGAVASHTTCTRSPWTTREPVHRGVQGGAPPIRGGAPPTSVRSPVPVVLPNRTVSSTRRIPGGAVGPRPSYPRGKGSAARQSRRRRGRRCPRRPNAGRHCRDCLQSVVRSTLCRWGATFGDLCITSAGRRERPVGLQQRWPPRPHDRPVGGIALSLGREQRADRLTSARCW